MQCLFNRSSFVSNSSCESVSANPTLADHARILLRAGLKKTLGIDRSFELTVGLNSISTCITPQSYRHKHFAPTGLGR